MELENYLRRINYNGDTEPTVELLDALQKHHLQNIPFENLDIHYGKPIELNIEKIQEKVINKRRGGFCYELNGLFSELLRSIGINIKIVSARVFNSEQQKFGQEFDHMAIVANINTFDYLVDVGFGEFALQPLKIELNKIQTDERGVFKIENHDANYLKVSKQVGDDWNIEYIFSLKERTFNEFEEMCKYHQTSTQSHFTQKKVCSIPTQNGRITITDDKIKITDGNSQTEQQISNEEEFKANLKKYFNIEID